jgi:hypothetical protein
VFGAAGLDVGLLGVVDRGVDRGWVDGRLGAGRALGVLGAVERGAGRLGVVDLVLGLVGDVDLVLGRGVVEGLDAGGLAVGVDPPRVVGATRSEGRLRVWGVVALPGVVVALPGLTIVASGVPDLGVDVARPSGEDGGVRTGSLVLGVAVGLRCRVGRPDGWRCGVRSRGAIPAGPVSADSLNSTDVLRGGGVRVRISGL